jgi:hypothetical protein
MVFNYEELELEFDLLPELTGIELELTPNLFYYKAVSFIIQSIDVIMHNAHRCACSHSENIF